MHDPPAAIELPQVLLDSANGAGALTETPVAALLPGLATVTVCAALVDPTATLPNDTLVGDAVSALAPPSAGCWERCSPPRASRSTRRSRSAYR